MRVIRSQADSLLQVDEKELAAMRIGLAHRYIFIEFILFLNIFF
jgi:hypothetical protein